MDYPLKGYVILGVLFSCLGSVLLVPGLVLLITYYQNESENQSKNSGGYYRPGKNRIGWKSPETSADPPEKVGGIILLVFASVMYLMSVISFLLAKQYFKPDSGEHGAAGRERSARRKRTTAFGGNALDTYDYEPKPGKKSAMKLQAANANLRTVPNNENINVQVIVEKPGEDHGEAVEMVPNDVGVESHSIDIESSDRDEASKLFDDIQAVEDDRL